MSQPIVPVILAGGAGTRLWPMSRVARPKQFLQLTSEISLFQQTLERVADRSLYAAPIVVTNQEYRFLVAEQAQEVGVELASVLLEPVARNTTAAIAAAVLVAAQGSKQAIVHILSSDHHLPTDKTYWACVETARKAAEDGLLVTFGIEPTEAATGYGYIQSGEKLPSGASRIAKFIEKPDAATAEKMLLEGGFLWNSGMFMFSAARFVQECKALAPKVLAATSEAVQKARRDLDFTRLDEEAFAKSPNISVDYAIFEPTKAAAVVPAAIAWSDLGSWDAVWKTHPQDAEGNVAVGPSTLMDTKGSLVVSESLHVAVQGLEDVAIIVSEDAVYAGKLSDAQSVGKLVKTLKQMEATAALTETHVTTYRPWGGYSSVLQGERFQVKRLFVKPGKRLSLQKHHHRSEHWVVVRGTAEVTIGDKVTMLGENQSVYIPQGEVHRLANHGKMMLELIEVQTGSYLGEDDIIRLDDEFGRV